MSAIVLSPGEKVEKTFTFTSPDGGSSATLEVVKKETAERTYELAVKYLGFFDNKDYWKVNIKVDDRQIKPATGFGYVGSKKIAVEPVPQSDYLEIVETDDKETLRFWVRLDDDNDSSTRTIVRGNASYDCTEAAEEADIQKLEIDESVKSLIEKGKELVAGEGKKVGKILYHPEVGLIVYARKKDQDDKAVEKIYFFDIKDGKFIEPYEAFCQFICRCQAADVVWKVRRYFEEKYHTLKFSLTDTYLHGYPSWDGRPLKVIKTV
ncbi:MAG: hypothetical protein H7A37_01960 [Chlamydiales bacterium]|nr:hypothetical protein [Chlamydiales bacterium]